MILLFLGALIIFMIRFKSGDIRWSFSLPLAILLLLLFLAAQINSLPLLKAHYPTQQSFGTYLGIAIVAVVIGSLIYGLFILLTGSAGDSLAREVYPKSMSVFSDPSEDMLSVFSSVDMLLFSIFWGGSFLESGCLPRALTRIC